MNINPNKSQFPTHLSRLVFTPSQTAEIMGVKVSTVYAWISRGEIASTKVGYSRFISGTQLSAFANGKADLDSIDYTYSNRVMQ